LSPPKAGLKRKIKATVKITLFFNIISWFPYLITLSGNRRLVNPVRSSLV